VEWIDFLYNLIRNLRNATPTGGTGIETRLGLITQRFAFKFIQCLS